MEGVIFLNKMVEVDGVDITLPYLFYDKGIFKLRFAIGQNFLVDHEVDSADIKYQHSKVWNAPFYRVDYENDKLKEIVQKYIQFHVYDGKEEANG